MEKRFYGLVLIIIGELLSNIIGFSAFIFFHPDVKNTVVFWPVFISFVNLEGKVGTLAPFSRRYDVETFVIDHGLGEHRWSKIWGIWSAFKHFELVLYWGFGGYELDVF